MLFSSGRHSFRKKEKERFFTNSQISDQIAPTPIFFEPTDFLLERYFFFIKSLSTILALPKHRRHFGRPHAQAICRRFSVLFWRNFDAVRSRSKPFEAVLRSGFNAFCNGVFDFFLRESLARGQETEETKREDQAKRLRRPRKETEETRQRRLSTRDQAKRLREETKRRRPSRRDRGNQAEKTKRSPRKRPAAFSCVDSKLEFPDWNPLHRKPVQKRG